MERLNYGVAMAVSGDFQTVDTTAGPGIKDDYSSMRSEPFTFLVAPHNYVDQRLGISLLTDGYKEARRNKMADQSRIKSLILAYHGTTSTVSRPTWADDPDTEWYVNTRE